LIPPHKHRCFPCPPLQHIHHSHQRRRVQERLNPDVHRLPRCRPLRHSHLSTICQQQDRHGLAVQDADHIDKREAEAASVNVGADHQVVTLDVEPAALLERRICIFRHFPPGKVDRLLLQFLLTLQRGGGGFGQDPGRGALRQDLDISGLSVFDSFCFLLTFPLNARV